MKRIQSYKGLLVYTLIFVLSCCVLFHKVPGVMAASLTVTETSQKWNEPVLWWDGYWEEEWALNGSTYQLKLNASNSAYVQYKATIGEGEEGWYKLRHGSLPSNITDLGIFGTVDHGDRDAQYSIKADNEHNTTITVKQTGQVSWESAESYCFKEGEHGEAFRITTGAYLESSSLYTYAPPMTLVPDASKSGLLCDGSKDVEITITISDNGYITFNQNISHSSTSETVKYGSTPSYTFTPDEEYVIESVTVKDHDGKVLETIKPESGSYTYSFTPVYKDKEISVVFKEHDYVIDASVQGNGTISPLGDVYVLHGARQTFAFEPNDGHIVSALVVDNETITDPDILSSLRYTFTNIEGDRSIEVQFSGGFTIEHTHGLGGSISPSSPFHIGAGGNQTFSIIPDSSCYGIASVVVDGAPPITDNSVTFSNVQANHGFHVEFEMKTANVKMTSIRSTKAEISPEDREKSIGCGGRRDYTITYESDAEDLYIYINGLPTKLLAAGESTGAPNFDHNANSRTFTFSVYPTKDTVIYLYDVIELADYPLDIVTRPAPPNIMFVLDDSGSMDFEFMTTETGGEFDGYSYIFDATDNLNFYELSGDDKKQWKSRWFGHNKLYYNPSVIYQPWPDKYADNISSKNFMVKEHPVEDNNPNFSLSKEYMKVDKVSVPRAHYFVTSGSQVILVTFDHTNRKIKYYEVETSGDGNRQKVKSLTNIDEGVVKIPGVVIKPTSSEDGAQNLANYMEQAQNFANWFTFYRRRELTAIAAISQVVDKVTNTYIGMLSIQNRIKQSLLPVRVMYLGKDGNFVIKDEVGTLFNRLYASKSSGGTPLRAALKNVGEYYDQTPSSPGSGGLSSDSPWFLAEEGGACQQSFAVAMTDGFYNGSVSGIGNVDGTSVVGYTAEDPYKDNYSDTLADIAMKYYYRDLVPSLGDSVPGEGRQHMKTYTVSFGVNGSLGDPDEYTLVPGCEGNDCNYPEWLDPTNSGDSPKKIDDLFHAAVNGRGLYLNAGDPQELVDALTEIIVDISDQSGSAASVSINGDQFYSDASSDDLLMYQTQYVSPDWVGRVYAYKVNTDGTVDTDDPEWEASEELDEALSGGKDEQKVAARIIATYSDSVASKGIKFDKLTDLSTAQQEYFDASLDGTTKEDLFYYIRGASVRGDKKLESSTFFRERKTRLGDIVNSGAHYHNGYLYVGANDGMMHAFDGKTGEEKFAYIPSMVLPNLKSLASQTYGDGHRFFVDGTPMVTKMGEKSYLVGGLGRGGNGYYSIDVSKPESIKDSSDLAEAVLWEYPQADTPQGEYINDLGNTFSKAHTVKSYASSTYKGEPNTYAINGSDENLDGYVTFFGNGYVSPGGHAVLYFLNPKTGKLIKKIDVGGTAQNGMGTPVAVDINNDNKMDYIYGGDLEGNMWKFDVQSPNPDDWQVAYCDDGNDFNSCKNSTEPKPLVKTADNQSITSSPDVVRHPSGTGYMVVFGTGRFLSAADWDDSTKQSFYGIWDFGDDDDDTEYLGRVSSGGGLLDKNGNRRPFSLLEQVEDYYGPVQGVVGADGQPITDKIVRVLSDRTPDWSLVTDRNEIPLPIDEAEKDPKSHAGWFFTLPLEGEKTTVDAIIRDGKAILVSFTPNGDRCAGGANSLIHELDVYTGGRLDKPSFDVNGDGVIDEKDLVKITVKDKDGKDIDIFVPPSAIQKDGRLQAPSIIGLGKDSDVEIKHFSSSSGEIETVVEEAEDVGVYYWREF